MSRYDLAAEQADHALACAERLAEIRQLLSCPEGADCACHEPSFACNFDVRN